MERGYGASPRGSQFVAFSCFLPEWVVQLQRTIGHYRASCLVVKLRRRTGGIGRADVGDTERSCPGVGGDLGNECRTVFAGEGVEVGGDAVADRGVDDEVRGEGDGWIGDASFCDGHGQVVADRAEACGQGIGLGLADVGFGVVLSHE